MIYMTFLILNLYAMNIIIICIIISDIGELINKKNFYLLADKASRDLRNNLLLLSNQTGRLSLWFVLWCCGLDHVPHGEFTCHAMPQ